jgi:DNA-binding CsgD family transcriptional regulator
MPPQLSDLVRDPNFDRLRDLLSEPALTDDRIDEVQRALDELCDPLPGLLHINDVPTDTVVFVASKGKQLYGWEPDIGRRLGTGIYELFHPDDWVVADMYDDHGNFKTVDGYSNFYRVKHAITGEWCWVHGQYMHLTYTDDGGVRYFIGYANDLTYEIDLGNVPEFARHLLSLKNEQELARLTSRERDVLTLIAEGHTDRQVADQLSISPHTAATHRKNLQKKLEVRNTAGLVRSAVMFGLVSV